MQLYRSISDPTRWFAFGPETGWVAFPPEFNGWEERKPVAGISPDTLREVPLRMGFNTGIPGAPWRSAEVRASAPPARLREAA